MFPPAPKGTIPGGSKTNMGKGRAKGSENRYQADIKEMIIKALNNAGGVKYLTAQAHKNPAVFLGLVGKVLPMTIQGPGGSALIIEQIVSAGMSAYRATLEEPKLIEHEPGQEAETANGSASTVWSEGWAKPNGEQKH